MPDAFVFPARVWRGSASIALAALAFALVPGSSRAGSRTEAGIESQVYPTGVIGAARLHVRLGPRDLLTLRGGYNDAERDDNGEHDDERGGGPGLSVGYRRQLQPEPSGWFVGGRVDLWRLEIDWLDDPGGPAEVGGTTDVLVVQPTAEAGYRFALGRRDRWAVEPFLAFGLEINVDTDGEEVGEGAILLGGIGVSYRF